MTELSPAAQAVFNAFGKHPIDHDKPGHGILYGALPAALRALADHNAPAWDGTGPACHWSPLSRTRQELINIADELEALGSV